MLMHHPEMSAIRLPIVVHSHDPETYMLVLYWAVLVLALAFALLADKYPPSHISTWSHSYHLPPAALWMAE